MRQEVLAYSSFSKFLHWLVALLVIMMLSFSFFLDDLPDADIPQAFMIHKSIGLSILFLMLLRIFWVIWKGKPLLPASTPRWQRAAAQAVHHSLNLLLVLMPITGWIMSVAAGRVPTWFNLFSLPFPGVSPDKALAGVMNLSHKTIAWILIALIIIHILGALKHHFIDKDDIMQRMLPDQNPH